MDEDITGWFNQLSEAERARIYEAQIRWHNLPPALRKYYNIKGGYFMRRRFISGLIALAVILVGIAAYFFDQHPLVSIGLVIVGILLGVIFVWETESKK